MALPKDFGSTSDIFGFLSSLGRDSKTIGDYLVPGAPSNPTRASVMLSWIKRAQGGIWFSRNDGQPVRFSQARALPVDKYGDLTAILGWIGVEDPGVYAILTGRRVLYFGESEAMTRRATSSHEHFVDWCREANGSENLQVAFYHMPRSSKQERMAVESALIKHRCPPCNEQFNPFAEYLGF